MSSLNDVQRSLGRVEGGQSAILEMLKRIEERLDRGEERFDKLEDSVGDMKVSQGRQSGVFGVLGVMAGAALTIVGNWFVRSHT